MEPAEIVTNGMEKPSTVKKVVYRKPPVVKQTKTSMYRAVKANPLFLLKEDGNEQPSDFTLTDVKLPKAVIRPVIQHRSIIHLEPWNSNPNPKPKNIKTGALKPGLTRTSSLRCNLPSTATTKSNVPFKRTGSLKVSSKMPKNDVLSKQPPQAKAPAKAQPPTSTGKESTARVKTANGTKRRSLSAEHFDRKKRLPKVESEQLIERKEATQSLEDVVNNLTLALPAISPIVEEGRRVTFKTPTANLRRSVFSTPRSFRRPYASTPGPSATDLERRLEDWLQRHKKPVGSYHHLKCFGLNHLRRVKEREEENKENVEDAGLARSDSYEELRIIPGNSNAGIPAILESNTSAESYEDLRLVAQGALKDLHKLIIDGYPQEQCEAWLGMIRQKYRDLEDEPQYWECRAAIEQSRGNLTSAVECLRTAIVQGAEVKTVDHSLEQLLEKFSLLNISTSEPVNDDIKKRDRTRIVLDARSVFKSSIIQFAVQERTLKKKQQAETSMKKFVATPVRRSTRNSRSRYSSTPRVQMCTSLNELDDSLRTNINFQGNKALTVNYHY